jgi:hypothetical protein
MKCVKNKIDGKTMRVSDTQAKQMVESGNYKYISKTEYKTKTSKK